MTWERQELGLSWQVAVGKCGAPSPWPPDDLVLLANTKDDLKAMLKLLAKWCHTWHMQVNEAKCGVMVCPKKPRGSTPTPDIRMPVWDGIRFAEGELISKVTEATPYKYLGIMVGPKMNLNHSRKAKITAITARLQRFARPGSIPTGLQMALVKPILGPVAMHGLEHSSTQKCLVKSREALFVAAKQCLGWEKNRRLEWSSTLDEMAAPEPGGGRPRQKDPPPPRQSGVQHDSGPSGQNPPPENAGRI